MPWVKEHQVLAAKVYARPRPKSSLNRSSEVVFSASGVVSPADTVPGTYHARSIEKTRSIDPEFYELMIDGASDAIVEAYLNMEAGELYYFETAGIGRSERNNNYMDDEYDYLFNKRYDNEVYLHEQPI